MAALDDEPFPSMVHVVSACFGGGRGGGAHRPSYMCVCLNITRKHSKRNAPVFVLQRQRKVMTGMMAGISSSDQHPVARLLCVSRPHLIRILSHHI